MPCREAMITNVITVNPEQVVEDVLHILCDKSIRGVPVVDGERNVLGIFRSEYLLEQVLPVSVTADHEFNMDFRLDYLTGTSTDVGDRLQKLMKTQICDVMEHAMDLIFVSPETPLWEGVRLLVKYESPLAVVEKPGKSNRLEGVITPQTMIHALSLKDGKALAS